MVCGMLRVAERFTDIHELAQTRMRILPGAPVFIHHSDDEMRAPAGVDALTPMSAEHARGAPLSQQFELRDD
jgi:hypothetical protein